tara:strand:- start:538 stop:2214 length:1677 start_codon:yes stop_codon:yes gene_type:complete
MLKQTKQLILIFFCLLSTLSCSTETSNNSTSETLLETPFLWEAANLYFLMTDRFQNGDPSNDINFNRTQNPDVLRGFEGGDLKGITQKIQEGYFTDLGVNAIWMTPIVEQIHGGLDSNGNTSYGFHGYWTKDWTALDPNFGTESDLHELVTVAHENGIRIVLDAVLNHTGPTTPNDPTWESSWVRTETPCTYESYDLTVSCNLSGLPDIKTESEIEVSLPSELVNKWKNEGRYDKEISELDAYFLKTGYPKLPKYYIIKWLTDYISEFGIDGYRVDTVKHTEENVWSEFNVACEDAFQQWKSNHPADVLDNNSFYLVGEAYDYSIKSGQSFIFPGGVIANYFQNGFHSLINFDFQKTSLLSYEELFTTNDWYLHRDLNDYGTLNFLSSHDDISPFDRNRSKTYQTGTKLLLAPGTSQIFYGDESARTLNANGASGDAALRSLMNWEEIDSNTETQKLLVHWQKLGRFRIHHPSIGAGKHSKIQANPYVFKRTFTRGAYQDKVVIGIDFPIGNKNIPVSGVFKDGRVLTDAYSGIEVTVTNGIASINTSYTIVLLELKK